MKTENKNPKIKKSPKENQRKTETLDNQSPQSPESVTRLRETKEVVNPAVDKEPEVNDDKYTGLKEASENLPASFGSQEIKGEYSNNTKSNHSPNISERIKEPEKEIKDLKKEDCDMCDSEYCYTCRQEMQIKTLELKTLKEAKEKFERFLLKEKKLIIDWDCDYITRQEFWEKRERLVEKYNGK